MDASTPLDGIELILADLDGVIYRGLDPIPYAVESINAAVRRIRIGYITNNASRTDSLVAKHLGDLGLSVNPEDVVTSPQAAVKLLADLVEPGDTVLVVGGEGLVSEVVKAGFVPTASALDMPAAVIQGFDPTVGWLQLAEATYALQADADGRGIPWVATNMDWTIPQARGTAPGNGTLVSAVHTAVGRLPVVAGKPEVAIFEAALERFGAIAATATLVIGDRLDTDILGANRAGMRSALVLTGIDQAKQVLAADKDQRPEYILDDLRQLHEPYPRTVSAGTGGCTITTVGAAVVRREGHTLTVEDAGGAPINLLRAGAAAIWNSGVAIYALDVPVELYS